MCAAQAEAAPVVKNRQMKKTSLPPLRHSHPRPVENSVLCKMIQTDHRQMLADFMFASW